jgi:hypothetical protein
MEKQTEREGTYQGRKQGRKIARRTRRTERHRIVQYNAMCCSVLYCSMV